MTKETQVAVGMVKNAERLFAAAQDARARAVADVLDAIRKAADALAAREAGLDIYAADLGKRALFLQEREVAVAARETSLKGLREELGNRAARIKTLQDACKSCVERNQNYKRERDEARDKLGRIQVALPGVEALLTKREQVGHIDLAPVAPTTGGGA